MTMRAATGWVGLSLLVLAGSVAGACGGGGASTATFARAADEPAPASLGDALSASCASRSAHLGPRPEPGVRQGSTVALAREGERLFAYVADRDRKLLTVIDVKAQRHLASAPLAGTPEQLLVLPDGRVVVAIGSASHVEVFEPAGDATPIRLCAREVPAGPFGFAISPDGKTLAVTSAWDAALTALDTSTLTALGVSRVARAPRGVLIDDRRRAFVSHLAGGDLSVVDLDALTASPRSVNLRLRAGSARAQTPDLEVERGATQAYALVGVEIDPAVRTNTPGAAGPLDGAAPERPGEPLRGKAPPPVRAPRPPQPPVEALPSEPQVEPPVEAAPIVSRIIVPMVSVDPGDPKRPTRLYYGPPPVAGVPKQAATAVVVDARAERTLSTRIHASTSSARRSECLIPRAAARRPGTDMIYVACLGSDELFELDARSSDPMRAVLRRFSLPKGPTGVAIAAAEGIAVVLSEFDGTLSLVPIDDAGGASPIAIAATPPAADAKLVLGRELFYRTDDARITSDGVACSSCHPDGGDDGLSWSTPEGMRQTLMLAGRVKDSAPYGWTRNQGTLEEYIHDTSTRLGGGRLPPHETQALAAYVKALPKPPHRAAKAAAVRGQAIFLSQGCGTCHVGITGTDKQSHAVADDSTSFDTPSLLGVGATGPYFHDGRYATLDDLLGDKTSRMAHTATLPQEDRDALRAFMESL